MIKKLFKNSLISGSFVLFLGMMISNFGNYLYHLVMGRMLGPVGYGSLVSLISLIYLISIISGTLSLTIIKFVTYYKAKKELRKIYWMLIKLTKFFLALGTIIFVFFFISRTKISLFLNISDSTSVLVVGIWMVFGLLAFINDSILRGFLRFDFVSLNSVISVMIKLFLSIFLVKLGLSVVGAIGAIVISSAVCYLISFYPLRFLRQYRGSAVEVRWKDFFSYSFPVLMATFGLNSLYSTDVILVKHYLPSFEAGLYSSLSMVGRIIFFASSTIPAVMFPLVSERFENGKNHRNIFKQSFLFVAFLSLVLTIFYFLFPKLTISLLYGNSYLEAVSLLGYFAVFISLFSLSSLFVNYYLSIRETKMVIFPFAAALGQAILIYFFHSSLFQIIQISLVITTLLLISLSLFFLRNDRKK